MGLLEGSFQPRDATEMESIMRELEGAGGLLPLKVAVSTVVDFICACEPPNGMINTSSM
jgi:hypothetical protein